MWGLIMWEQKLVESVFDSSSEPIFVTERQSRKILICNSATESLFGWSRSELIGQPSRILAADSQHWQEVATKYALVLEAGGVADFTMAGRHRDGHVFPVRVRGKLFRHEDGAYTVIYVQDLSEIEKAAHALSERMKERRCEHAVADVLSHMEVSLAERLKQLPAIVRAGWQFPDHAHVAIVVRGVASSTAGYGPGVAQQRRLIRAQGQEVGAITVSYDREFPQQNGGPFLKEEDELLDALAERIGAAIERQDLEDTRSRTAARLSFLSESLPLSIAIADWETGALLYANARARLELGVGDQDELRLLRVGELYADAQDRIRIRADLERDGIVKGRVVQVRIAGQTQWNSIYAELFDFEGRRAVYIIRSDVTEQRNAEEAARQAQKLQSIGQLASGVAHDFNNLLAALSMHMEMLREEQEERGGDASRSVELVASVVERGASLTRQLLSFARQQALKAERVEVGQLLDALRPFLARTLGGHIQVAVTKAAGESWISVDKGLLESAILNLSINARDAMPEGGSITISIGPHVEEPGRGQASHRAPGAYVEIAVADTGTGMPPEILERVFEPFFTTKEVGRGTGLGLAMVHGFVRQSGGFTTIDSTVGVGTVVRLSLPREDAASAAETVAAPNIRGHEALLLVDDDDMVRMPLAQKLASLGYSVTEAPSGAAALQAIERSPPDLLITDIMMPGILGTDFVRLVRERHPDLPVLVMSGNGMEKWLAMPPPKRADFCAKPFRLEELGAKIRTLLEN
ncbi:MAG: ATP-binding protein [Reyranellaceae bacterium]